MADMMDVFKGDAFSMMSLLAAMENVDYSPQYLGSLGLFQDEYPDTRVVGIESRDDTLALIPTSPIGAPLAEKAENKRNLRNFSTFRIAKGSTIMAEELQGIRAFGSTTVLEQMQTKIARRLNRIVADVELTWEHMRLGAVQGILTDADDSTLYNFFTEFGVAQPAVVTFDFTALAAGEVRAKIETDIVRPMIRAAKGAFVTGSRIIALVGDDFWNALVNHAEVRQTYLNYTAAAELRNPTAFGTFNFAGVEWVNYRGTDDQSTVAIASDEAKFFPASAPGIFQVAWAPGEFMDTVNQPGRPMTPLMLTDQSGRNAWARVEVYSYPLYICTRPLTLRRAQSV
jgi:hypothetical protein